MWGEGSQGRELASKSDEGMMFVLISTRRYTRTRRVRLELPLLHLLLLYTPSPRRATRSLSLSLSLSHSRSVSPHPACHPSPSAAPQPGTYTSTGSTTLLRRATRPAYSTPLLRHSPLAPLLCPLPPPHPPLFNSLPMSRPHRTALAPATWEEHEDEAFFRPSRGQEVRRR
jgi:hypothetical protein